MVKEHPDCPAPEHPAFLPNEPIFVVQDERVFAARFVRYEVGQKGETLALVIYEYGGMFYVDAKDIRKAPKKEEKAVPYIEVQTYQFDKKHGGFVSCEEPHIRVDVCLVVGEEIMLLRSWGDAPLRGCQHEIDQSIMFATQFSRMLDLKIVHVTFKQKVVKQWERQK